MDRVHNQNRMLRQQLDSESQSKPKGAKTMNTNHGDQRQNARDAIRNDPNREPAARPSPTPHVEDHESDSDIDEQIRQHYQAEEQEKQRFEYHGESIDDAADVDLTPDGDDAPGSFTEVPDERIESTTTTETGRHSDRDLVTHRTQTEPNFDTIVDDGANETDGEESDTFNARQFRSIADVLTGSSSGTPFTVRPQVMLTCYAAISDENAPDTVGINGEYYSLLSPFRKGRGSEKSPYGIMRNPLCDIVNYVGKSADSKVMFFGDSDDLPFRIESLLNHFEAEANNLAFSLFGDIADPTISVPSESDEDSPDYDLSVRSVYDVSSWMSVTRGSDSEAILRPTINISVNFPLLMQEGGLAKNMPTIVRIAKKYSETASSELGAENMHVAFAFNSADMLDPEILALLNHYEDDLDARVMSRTRIEQETRLDVEDQTASFIPATAFNLEQMLFRYGGDTLLIL